MNFILYSLLLLTFPLTSYSAPSTTEKATQFLLPKLNSKTKETHRKKNELLVDSKYKELKNKSGYALVFLLLNQFAPNTNPNVKSIDDPTANPWTDRSNAENKYTTELYLLKLTPKLTVEAMGEFNQSSLCECSDDNFNVVYELLESTAPLGVKDRAYFIEATLTENPSGGSFTYNYINAFRVKDGSLTQIWKAQKDTDFWHNGRFDDNPRSEVGSFKFISSEKSWILEGTDKNFLLHQSVIKRQIYVWDEKAQLLKEVADDERESFLCTETQLSKATQIAKSQNKRKKPSEAVTTLQNAIEKCSSYSSFAKALWLESDLLLYLYKSGEYKDCVTTSEALEKRKDFTSRPKEVREAIIHNKKLCTEKNKTPAL